MRALVYNGTGSQGGAVIGRLLQNGHEPVAITRDDEKARTLRDQGVRVFVGDVSDPAVLAAAHAGVDAVVLTVPILFPEVAQGVNFAQRAIDAAKAAGVKLIVYNTSGPVVAKSVSAAYDIRPKIISVLEQSGVPFITLQPSVYMENLLGPWTRMGIIERDELAYPVAAHTPTGWLATADLGALMVAALERPELAPAHIPVSGMENLTGPELAARVSQALGRTITYRAMPLDEFAAVLDAIFGPGGSRGIVPGYELIRDNPEMSLQWVDMRPVLEKLPVTLTSVETWVRQVAPLLTPDSVPTGR